MTIIRNIIVAFSMYSRIPMPILNLTEEDTKYAIGFLPLIGAIIGILDYFMVKLCLSVNVPIIVITLLWAFIPLVITGGFHVDGFMDVCDALNSYKGKEDKLRILKDPHIGAFSVISFAMYGLLYLASTYLLLYKFCENIILISCIGFVLIRGGGAILSIVLKKAKTDGMLHEETKATNVLTKGILIITLLICLLFILFLDFIEAILLVIVISLYSLWFKNKCYKEFGGINGDAIGFYITEAELLVMCLMAVLSFCK